MARKCVCVFVVVLLIFSVSSVSVSANDPNWRELYRQHLTDLFDTSDHMNTTWFYLLSLADIDGSGTPELFVSVMAEPPGVNAVYTIINGEVVSLNLADRDANGRLVNQYAWLDLNPHMGFVGRRADGQVVLVAEHSGIVNDPRRGPQFNSLKGEFSLEGRSIVFTQDNAGQSDYEVLPDMIGRYTLAREPMPWLEDPSIIAGFENIDRFLNGFIGSAQNNASAISVTLDGEAVTFPDQPPTILEGRAMVPISPIVSAMGGSSNWNDSTQQVTISLQDTSLVFTISSDIMLVNGNPVQLDVPASIINERTMVPLRAISDGFGFSAVWDSETRTSHITR